MHSAASGFLAFYFLCVFWRQNSSRHTCKASALISSSLAVSMFIVFKPHKLNVSNIMIKQTVKGSFILGRLGTRQDLDPGLLSLQKAMRFEFLLFKSPLVCGILP